MSITKATAADIPALNKLVNSAYRGEDSRKGWTTETDILDGIRIDENMLISYFENDAVTILKYTDDNGQLAGTVYLEIKGSKLYLGMLSTAPEVQGKGIGKALLRASEDFARSNGIATIKMTVINIRKELIAWYERHGYHFTGETESFVDDGRFGIPKVSFEMIVMEKQHLV